MGINGALDAVSSGCPPLGLAPSWELSPPNPRQTKPGRGRPEFAFSTSQSSFGELLVQQGCLYPDALDPTDALYRLDLGRPLALPMAQLTAHQVGGVSLMLRHRLENN